MTTTMQVQSVHKSHHRGRREGLPLPERQAAQLRSRQQTAIIGLPDIIKLMHVVSIAPRDMVTRTKEWFGPKVQFIKLNATESFDIDTPLDMEIAEMLYAKHPPE